MEFNFSQDEVNQIIKGLRAIGDDKLADKIHNEVDIKQELNCKMLTDFYGGPKEFEIVEVNEANTDRLEDIMSYYEDTNKTFYDDDQIPYSILESQDGLEVAINRYDWEDWLAKYDDEDEEEED